SVRTRLRSSFFFFHHPPPLETYTLSLHDALPIYGWRPVATRQPLPLSLSPDGDSPLRLLSEPELEALAATVQGSPADGWAVGWRSEEHTSELQSRENLVCRLLLEKKKRKKTKDMV